MKKVYISQRVDECRDYRERRDCLDQNWVKFLQACDCVPVILPNHKDTVRRLLDMVPAAGIILTGGNDLTAYGGTAPERDEVEMDIIKYAITNTLPLIGVCRGMQIIQHYFGMTLEVTPGHIANEQRIKINGEYQTVNSYHHRGTRTLIPEFSVWAMADDGIIKAIRHNSLPITAIMWHPERLNPILQRDIALFKSIM